MSSTATTSLKRSRSSTPSLGTPPRPPSTTTAKVPLDQADLATGEPQIKQELEQWENIVFSFGMEDNNGRSNSEEYPGDHQPHTTSHLHQHPGGHIDSTIGGVPGLPAPWDMSPFFPAPYGQPSPYDMLGLGAMNPIPLTHPHSSPHVVPDPFGNPWDLSLHTGMQRLHMSQQPLTPAEIAQYHALLARGAAGFPLSSLSTPQATTMRTPEGSPPSSAPISQSTLTRSRSTSNAGGSQSGAAAVTDEDVSAITEDKRRRNTAASARFRVKKKQRTMELERAIVELEGRADELEKEAIELRRENGWLKEMVILKGRKTMENVQTAKSSSSAGSCGSSDPDKTGEGSKDGDEGESANQGKDKSKE